ncbi:MAG: hypothetical protein K0U34_02710 [Alphaproteobacteria bacterium]|nr:hypothetical protein [Alphaproteobacteria bacterium]
MPGSLVEAMGTRGDDITPIDVHNLHLQKARSCHNAGTSEPHRPPLLAAARIQSNRCTQLAQPEALRMLMDRSQPILKALRDAGVGLAVYALIAVLALEDRAQAGNSIVSLPTTGTASDSYWGADPSLFTLIGLGILFSVVSAFTLMGLRHFSQTFVLARVGGGKSQHWANCLHKQ